MLRVVPVPQSWLNEIRQLARKFVLHFWPSPHWHDVCQPFVNGGLGVINVHQQQFALQLIYIQRLLRVKVATDFVSPWIGHCIYLYTGHHSFLPWLQHPSDFHKLFLKLPTMLNLTKLLEKMPALLSDHRWSGRWFSDIPLRHALFSVVPSVTNVGSSATSTTDTVQPYDIEGIPLHYLVSDVITWSYYYNRFSNFLRINGPTGNSRPREILRLFESSSNNPVQWMALIQRYMPTDFLRDRPPEGYSLTRRNQFLSVDSSMQNRWVPSSGHWTISLNGSAKAFPISSIKPRILRLYWLQQERGSNFHLTQINRIPTPYVIPEGYCAPPAWRRF